MQEPHFEVRFAPVNGNGQHRGALLLSAINRNRRLWHWGPLHPRTRTSRDAVVAAPLRLREV